MEITAGKHRRETVPGLQILFRKKKRKNNNRIKRKRKNSRMFLFTAWFIFRKTNFFSVKIYPGTYNLQMKWKIGEFSFSIKRETDYRNQIFQSNSSGFIEL